MFTIYIDSSFSWSWAEFLSILTVKEMRFFTFPIEIYRSGVKVYLSRLLATHSCQLLKHEIIVTLDPNIWKKSWKDRVQLPVFQLSQSESFGNYCATEIVFAYNNHFNWKLANRETLPCTETSQKLKQIMMPKTLTCWFLFFGEKE